MLTYFNLTKQEAVLYVNLLAEGKLTGYEAAKLTGISRSNAYTALAGLVDKGAAYMIDGTPSRYTPVPAAEFCNNRLRQLTELKARILNELPGKQVEAQEYVTIKGERHIFDKMKNMLAEAKKRIYLSLSVSNLEQIYPELQSAVKRGIKVVIITNPPFSLEGAILYHAEKTQDQIRVISDSEKVLTGDVSNGENSTCLYSQKKNLIDLFKEAMKNEIKIIELTGEKN